MRAGDTLEALDALGAGGAHGSLGAGRAGGTHGAPRAGHRHRAAGRAAAGTRTAGVLVGAVDLHTKPSLHTDLGENSPCARICGQAEVVRAKRKGRRDASRFFL